jgi:hypothetical protein
MKTRRGGVDFSDLASHGHTPARSGKGLRSTVTQFLRAQECVRHTRVGAILVTMGYSLVK